MNGKRVKRISRRIVAARWLVVIFLLAATVICSTGMALANSVRLGSDYFQTLPGTSGTSGTFYDFPPLNIPGIGIVDPPLINFRGRPFGPSNPLPAGPPPPPGYPSNAQLALGLVDTIVQRQADAMLPSVGSSATIPIEMVALSLESVAPINVGGSFFDVFVHLTPGTHSTGMMTINHEFADNGTPAPEGTFSSFFDIFFTLELTPQGGVTPISVNSTEHLVQGAPLTPPAFWSHEPPLGIFFVDAPPFSNQIANRHLSTQLGFGDFYPTTIDPTLPPVTEIVPGQGQHVVQLAPAVPEPSTLLLLGSGLAGLLLWSRKVQS